MSNVVRLQADLEVAKLRHRAKRSVATAAALEAAQKAYDQATEGEEQESESVANETSETGTDELDANALRRVIIDFITGLSLEELEDLKAVLSRFWQGQVFASRAPLPWSVSGSTGRSNVAIIAQLAGDAIPSEVSGSGAGESIEEVSSDNLASTQPEAGAGDTGAAESAVELVTESVTPALPAITEPATPAAIPAGTSKKGQTTQKKTKETAK